MKGKNDPDLSAVENCSPEPISDFLSRFKKYVILTEMKFLATFDRDHGMSLMGGPNRSEQLNSLEELRQMLIRDPGLNDSLKRAEEAYELQKSRDGEIDHILETNFRTFKRHYEFSTKSPKELKIRLEKATNKAVAAHREAREKNEYKIFSPHLQTLIHLAKEQASHYDPHLKPYAVSLLLYDAGFSIEDITHLAEDLKRRLIPLAEAARAKASNETPLLRMGAEKEPLRDLLYQLALQIGLERESFSIHFSPHHGRCITLGPKDARIIVKQTSDNSCTLSELFVFLHEMGHLLHTGNIDSRYYYQPYGRFFMLSHSEAQASIWEKIVGRTHAFWEFWYPRIQSIVPDLREMSLGTFYNLLHTVSSASDAISTDNIHYPLYVIHRFEIERALFEGDLSVDDMPDAWNELSERYLGFRPRNLKEGALINEHLATAFFGSYPCYLPAPIAAAQLFSAAEKADRSLPRQFALGQCSGLSHWLKVNVHQYGARFSTQEILKLATGEPLNPDYYLRFIEMTQPPSR